MPRSGASWCGQWPAASGPSDVTLGRSLTSQTRGARPMMPSAAVTPRVEIDGRATTAGQLRAVALADYGHFTAMQVRDGCVRGLDLHLARLAAATQEVFQAGLD